MADTGELEIPMAWFWAGHVAEDLITRMGNPLSPGTFEFQAAHDVLALTMLFTDIASRPGELSADQLELIRDLVSIGGLWLCWCDYRLDAADRPAPSLWLARQAWRRLLLSSPPLDWRDATVARRPGAGCRIGLRYALEAVDARLTHPPQ
jgi:hypothetical protein